MDTLTDEVQRFLPFPYNLPHSPVEKGWEKGVFVKGFLHILAGILVASQSAHMLVLSNHILLALSLVLVKRTVYDEG